MHMRNHENFKKMKHKNFTLGGFCLGGFVRGSFVGGLCLGGFFVVEPPERSERLLDSNYAVVMSVAEHLSWVRKIITCARIS